MYTGFYGGFYGCSLSIVDEFLSPRGYSLVGCNFGYPNMPQGIRDAVYVRTDYLKDLGLEAIDYRAALDREPCAFSHLWADNKVDVRNWRNREDTDALLDSMRRTLTDISRQKYGERFVPFDLYVNDPTQQPRAQLVIDFDTKTVKAVRYSTH